MSRVRRIYAEKRPGYDVAARQLCQELREALGTEAISHVRIFQRYDVEGLSDAAFESARGIIFSEPNADMLYDETLPQLDAQLLAVEYLPGQYDQRADSAAQCLQLLSPEQAKPKVACAKVYAIEGDGVTGEMMEAFDKFVSCVSSCACASDVRPVIYCAPTISTTSAATMCPALSTVMETVWVASP